MSRVTKTFTYKVPDDYTLQEAENDSSASFTYHGPKYLHVHLSDNGMVKFVDETTLDAWNEEDANDHDNCLLLNALGNPLEASILWGMKDSDISDLPQKVKTGPDGVTYSYPWPLPPHKAYQADAMRWNEETLSWVKPYPWHRTWMTWSGIANQANSVVNSINTWLAENDSAGADSDIVAAYNLCKTEAENKVNDWQTAGLLPHEVGFRLTPGDSDSLVAALAAASDSA